MVNVLETIGFLVSGPLNHVLYDILNRVFAGKTGPKAKLLQLLASNLIISPIFNCGMCRILIIKT
jgi:peroxisomal membrane protein 2